jgi:hypothetical protein
MMAVDRTAVRISIALTLWAAWIVLALSPPIARAHDIPNDVVVQAYVKPVGERLQLLVRVPLKAMREVDYPKRGPGYLDLARASAALDQAAALWITDNVQVYEGDLRLDAPRLAQARISLESDKSFGSYQTALAHLNGPRLPVTAEIYWDQALLDVLLEYPIASERSEFSIHPRLERLGLRTTTVLRFVSPDGMVRAFEYHGDAGRVVLDPRWHQASLRFVRSGFLHILSGIDHLLFLLCLVIPFRRLLPLVAIVTAFTVAHSLTLAVAALGFGPYALWFPPLIETLIAASILYMALENIVSVQLARRWTLAFAFGLVHGFAFAYDLRQTLQFAGDHLVAALFAFNVGVELGQILVLLLAIPLLNALFRIVPERIATIIACAFIAHTAWHWLLERGEKLTRFPWSAPDAAALASLTRWLMVIVALGGLLWLVGVVREQRAQRKSQSLDRRSAS